MKAKDDTEAAEILIGNSGQHENTGIHLRQAVEGVAKALCEINGVFNYPKDGNNGHDLKLLFRMAEAKFHLVM